jgi:nucleotide-binding universal stress UspA family protein
MESSPRTTAHVLVACDLSEASDEAIRQADAWARRCGARLSALHVVPNLLGMGALFPQSAVSDTATQLELETRAIDALVEHVVTVTGRPPEEIKAHVCIGPADVTIVQQAEVSHADLVVVGATGRTGLARMWLGSTAERVARLAHCSVLVARPSPPSGHVLAPTDLSDPALPGVHAAAEEARRRGAKLHVLHVVEMGPPAWTAGAGLPFGASPMPLPSEALESMRTLAAESLRALTAGLDADILVAEGPAETVIVRTAETLPAELVVVTTHGRTGLARVALGSVAERVVRAVHCSVLVVRR